MAILAIELITIYRVHKLWTPSRRHSFLMSLLQTDVAVFTLMMPTVHGYYSLETLPQSSPLTSDLFHPVNNENQVTVGEVTTKDFSFLLV